MADTLIRAEWQHLNLRVILIDSTNIAQDICSRHQCTGLSAQVLSQAINAGLMVTPTLNDDERSTLRWQYSGSLQTLTVDVAANAGVRATMDDLQVQHANLEEAFGAGGKVGVVKSNAHRRLSSSMTLADRCHPALDLATFFDISDQVPTLCLNSINDKRHLGLMVQGMPQSKREDLETLEQQLNIALRDLESVDFSQDSALITWAEQWLKACSLEAGTLKIHQRECPHLFCTCSKEKIRHTLMGFPTAELEDMIKSDGGAQIDCQFCANSIRFEASDLQEIIKSKNA